MDIVIRASVAFAFVFLLTRITGRRNLSGLEPFDLILLVMMGDLVQQGVTQSDYSVTGLMIAAGTVSVLSVVISYASYRFRSLRPALDGEPIVLIEDGVVLEKNLTRQRMSEAELAEAGRLQQIASFEEVQWAILERSGHISFIPKKSRSK